MADLSFAIEIAAPPNLVFAFFVPQRMPYWYGAEMEACFEVLGESPEFETGLKIRITGRVGSKQVSHTAVVTGYEWGRRLEWQFQDAYGVRGLQSWEVSANAQDSRVVMRDRYEMPGRLGGFVDRLVTRHAVARRDRRDLERLKQLVERR
jgi:uncharacterized membrane protein